MLWNKIEVNNDIILKDSKPYYLEIRKNIKLNILVNKDVCTKLVIIAYTNYEINLELESNSNLIVNSLNKDNSVNVDIKLKEKANITYNHSSLAKGDSINYFNIQHLESDSISNLNNNGINLTSNKLFFTINGIIPKKLKNISCNQKSKIINYDLGNSKIIPNLVIDSNDIIATHSAFIGKIDDEIKFYIKSRGINDKDILKLIYQITLLENMILDEEKSEFNKIINEWW